MSLIDQETERLALIDRRKKEIIKDLKPFISGFLKGTPKERLIYTFTTYGIKFSIDEIDHRVAHQLKKKFNITGYLIEGSFYGIDIGAVEISLKE